MKLCISGIEYGYVKKQPVLHGISLETETGRIVGIVGPNGCGKTTFIKCVNKILSPWRGSVSLDGAELLSLPVEQRARYAAYVSQTQQGMPGTALDMILMGRRPYINWRLLPGDIDFCIDILRKLNMESAANKPFLELSGGQRQKILIGRALAQTPIIYLLDEPVSFLDIKNQLEVMSILRDLAHNENKIVLIILHDLNIAMSYCDTIVLMNNGRIVSSGHPSACLTPENIHAVYETRVEILGGNYIVPLDRQPQK
jgi:iron complex transport system ATP-binding protein